MRSDTPLYLKINAKDNVAIVTNDGGLPRGTRFPDGLTLIEDVPQAHKVALRPIAKGSPVLRYGVPVGYALEDIPPGAWVHEATVRMPSAPDLEELTALVDSLPFPAPCEPLGGHTFMGFRNADGSVGTRNMLAISTTVQCAAPVARIAVERIKAELLPKYPHVDGVVAIEHAYGCGVAIEAPDAYIPIRSLQNIAKNPNFGGLPLLVGLGCEKLTPERFFPEGSIPPSPLTALGEEHVINLQDERFIGFESMIDGIMAAAAKRLAILDARRRETCPASEIVLGLQCGGSDAFSGAAANPAVGVAADMLVRCGATVFFSEVTEVRDGIEQLVRRAANKDVALGLIREMAWYDGYLARGGADRSANTSPGNKKGGLNNIVEKSMGSIAKSGSCPISGVYGPGEKIPHDKKGLFFAATPASDIVCGPSQVAAGMNVLVFITGRGTPYGLAEVPTIKVVTRNELAARWHDLVDVNTGPIVTGGSTIEEKGREIFDLILQVAGGKKPAAERLKLHNYMAVFNPAPLT
ncbi:(D)-galactarate dehydrogenase [uncultured delta proteobacterium]|uniref:Galactarate dehydratase n=1 Tax=uncultured delta proteobacterium TaxID=34034 RepID=A0A212KAA1_9DELT|nr:(D)-galactarate dehydrogenase [uncultured delta proteobacterium]